MKLSNQYSEKRHMIVYTPLYETMRKRGISTYRLITYHGLSRALINRLKHNQAITTVTLNDLCRILDCRPEDILAYVPDGDDTGEDN